MNRPELKELLTRLPAHEPAEDFTTQTLRRLDEEPARGGALWRWAAVGAMACLLLVLLGAFVVHHQAQAEKQAALQELQELRAEYVRVREKLHALKDDQKLVYLGGTDQAEYVVDLSKLNTGAFGAGPEEY